MLGAPVPSKSQRVPFLATGSLRCSWRPGGLAADGLSIPQHERRRVALSKHSIQSKIADRSSSSADPKLLVENLESQCAEEALSDRILERVTGGRRFYDASDMRTWEGSDDVRSPNALRGALVDATLDPSCALRCGAVELWRHVASCVPTTCGSSNATDPSIRTSGDTGGVRSSARHASARDKPETSTARIFRATAQQNRSGAASEIR